MRAKGFTFDQWTSKMFENAAHNETYWATRLDLPLKFILKKPVMASSGMGNLSIRLRYPKYVTEFTNIFFRHLPIAYNHMYQSYRCIRKMFNQPHSSIITQCRHIHYRISLLSHKSLLRFSTSTIGNREVTIT